jgi:hypothetical protein
MTIGTDDQPQNAGALVLGLAGFFGVLGLGPINRNGGADASTDPID